MKSYEKGQMGNGKCLRIERPAKINRAATSSPRCRPGSQSLGIARRAKCPPTSTARFRRAHSALVLVIRLYTDALKHSSPVLPDHRCCPPLIDLGGSFVIEGMLNINHSIWRCRMAV